MVRDAARLARYGGIKELKRRPAHAISQLLFYAVTLEAEAGRRATGAGRRDGVATLWWEAMAAHRSQAKTRGYAGLQWRAPRCTASGRASPGHPALSERPLVFESLQPLGRAARQF